MDCGIIILVAVVTDHSVSEAERELLRAEAQAVCDLYNELKPVNWKDPCEEYTEEPPCNETVLPGLLCLDGHICSIGLHGYATRQGTIPQTIGNFSRLSNLNLSLDKLTGTIPDTVSRLLGLQALFLWNNSLTGEFPCIQNLTLLIIIELDSNLFTGTLPTWISNFSMLSHLRLQVNHFSGTVPPLPSSLQILNLRGNALSGTLDDFLNLTQLIYMDLSENQFSGSIPSSIVAISNLQNLILSQNQFTGRIPPELLSGSSRLSMLKLDENFLSGPLPNCSLSTILVSIQLFSNQLSGDLPATMFTTTVKKLMLQNNFITGTLPIPPKPLKLSTLDLSSNMISGTIPLAFWLSAPRLGSLNMSHNQFWGSIESYNSTISFFDLSYNFLNGTIPLVISEGKFVHCHLEQNCFTCNSCVMCGCNNTRGPSECPSQTTPSSFSSSSTSTAPPPSPSTPPSVSMMSLSLPPGSMSGSPPLPPSEESQSKPVDDSSLITIDSSNSAVSASTSLDFPSHLTSSSTTLMIILLLTLVLPAHVQLSRNSDHRPVPTALFGLPRRRRDHLLRLPTTPGPHRAATTTIIIIIVAVAVAVAVACDLPRAVVRPPFVPPVQRHHRHFLAGHTNPRVSSQQIDTSVDCLFLGVLVYVDVDVVFVPLLVVGANRGEESREKQTAAAVTPVNVDVDVDVKVVEGEVKDESVEGEPTPSDPKRRRKDTPTAAAVATSVPMVVECVMCKEAAKYMCEECTKALGRGGEKMLCCDSCWSKAHWSASLKSHAKLDLSAHVLSPQQGTKMCETHHLPLDVFCEVDNTLICSRCHFFSISHKGHKATSVEEVSYKRLQSPKEFFEQLSRLESELNTLATLIKSETVNIKLEQSQFAETVGKEFSDLISCLERRRNELLSTSETIASSKVGALSKYLEILSTGLQHIEKYKSKCSSMLKSGDTSQVIDLFESIPAILKQLEPKPEHLTLSHHVSATVSSTDNIERFKKSIPGLGVISTVPVLLCIKEQKNAVSGPLSVAMFGCWPKTATNNDIQVRVGELQCTNVNIATPGSVLTFKVPQGVGQNLPVSLSVFGTPADRPNDTRISFPDGDQATLPVSPSRLGMGGSTGSPPVSPLSPVQPPHQHRQRLQVRSNQAKAPQSGANSAITGPDIGISTRNAASAISIVPCTWEWDQTCRGNLLQIKDYSNSTVHKPPGSAGYKQSTVTATTKLQVDASSADTRVYQWHLSISNPGDFRCYYGLIDRPFDLNCPFPDIYGWSTDAECHKLPPNTPTFQATGGTEEVTLMYNPSTRKLTARWPRHNNVTATVHDIPTGLYPAVNIYHCNTTVKITPAD
ncbi:LRR-GTPase of the ROCO family [Pelomyxa schiedti]|nr:LRR-GTPase of the ROCO family [Pelomyxa schiedti]